MPSSSLKRLPAKAAKALEKAPEDEKLKLAAENAQKAFELAKSGEKIPETFKDFLEKWVYSCEDQSALLDKLGGQPSDAPEERAAPRLFHYTLRFGRLNRNV